MSLTLTEADNLICEKFWTTWNAAAVSTLAGYIPEVIWPGQEPSDKPNGSKYFARVSIQTVDEFQTAFVADDLRRRYTAHGLTFVQLFAPKNGVKSYDALRGLAQIAQSAFRGKSTSGLIFRNVRINNIPPEDLFYRLNVVAEFERDEIA